jgi:uncharacterized repeat protein (TIGR03803 family)
MPHSAPLASGLHFASRAAALFCLLTLSCVLPASAQTFAVLHAFSGLDGEFPSGGMTIAGNGNLYGVTPYGGTHYYGLAYELKLTGAGWVFTPLYQFQGIGDGINPVGDLTFGPDGALYGSALLGGAGAGTVFSLKPQPTICSTTRCPWLESTIWPFEGLQGEQPAYGALVFDQQGNAYGTTLYGGDNGDGVAYQLSRRGQVWTETRLYNFGASPSDGVMPFHNVVLDRAGNLYGTTYLGGAHGGGTVFQLVPSGGSWTENIIANFPAGAELQAGLIIDASGNLYGATIGVGTESQVFELSPSGNTWQLKVLHTFVTTMSNLGPMGNLAMDHTGNLYGTTYSLGVHGRGNIFELTPSNNGWTYTDLYDFTDQNDGAGPMGDLSIDSNGNVFGTAQSGGNGQGVVWELTP